MHALSDCLHEIKQRVLDAGCDGLEFHELLESLNIKLAVGIYLFRTQLHTAGYELRHGNYVISLGELARGLPAGACLCAPANDLRKAYGYEVHEENIPSFRESSPTTELLCVIAKSGVRGNVIHELDNDQFGDRRTMGILLDKLVLTGVVIKRLAMPLDPSTASRTVGAATVYHLRRYARRFAPAEDNLSLQPETVVRDDILRFFRELLDRHGVAFVGVVDLLRLLQLNNRRMQNLRNQLVQLDRQGELFPVRFVERLYAPIMHTNQTKCGKFRTVWCVEVGAITGDIDRDTMPLTTTELAYEKYRGLSAIEQLDYHLSRAPEHGLTLHDIRRLSGFGNKKAARIVDDFSSTKKNGYGYPTRKVQEAKVVMTSLLPKHVARVLIWNPKTTVTTASSTLLSSPSPTRSGGVARPSTTHAATPATKAAAPVQTPATPTTTTDGGFPSAELLDSCLDPRKAQRLAPHESREVLILHFLAQQPFFVSDFFGIKRTLQDHVHTRGLVYSVDKRTILRSLQLLCDRGLLCDLCLLRSEADARIETIYTRRLPSVWYVALNLQHPDAERFVCEANATLSPLLVRIAAAPSATERIEQRVQAAYEEARSRRGLDEDDDGGAFSGDGSDADSDDEAAPTFDTSDSDDAAWRRTPRPRKRRRRSSSSAAASGRSRGRVAAPAPMAVDTSDSEADAPPPTMTTPTRRRAATSRAPTSDGESDAAATPATPATPMTRRSAAAAAAGGASGGSKRKRRDDDTAFYAAAEAVQYVRLVGLRLRDASDGANDTSGGGGGGGFVPLSTLLRLAATAATGDAKTPPPLLRAIVTALQPTAGDTTATTTVTTTAATASETAAEGSDETWTLDEDLQLLERLTLTLFVRGAKIGLPVLLKPTFWRKMFHATHGDAVGCAQRIVDPAAALVRAHLAAAAAAAAAAASSGAGTDAVVSAALATPAPISPALSLLRFREQFLQQVWYAAPRYVDVAYRRWDVTLLRATYMLTTTIKTPTMSVSACRRHLPLLFRHWCQFLGEDTSVAGVGGSSGASLSGGGGLTSLTAGHLTLLAVATRLLFFRGDVSGWYLRQWQEQQAQQQAQQRQAQGPQTAAKAKTKANRNHPAAAGLPLDVWTFVDVLRFLLWQRPTPQPHTPTAEAVAVPGQDPRALRLLQRVFKNVAIRDSDAAEDEDATAAAPATAPRVFSVEDIAGVAVDYEDARRTTTAAARATVTAAEDATATDAMGSDEDDDEELPAVADDGDGDVDGDEAAAAALDAQTVVRVSSLRHKLRAPTEKALRMLQPRIRRVSKVAVVTADHLTAAEILRDLYVHMVVLRRVNVVRTHPLPADDGDNGSGSGEGAKRARRLSDGDVTTAATAAVAAAEGAPVVRLKSEDDFNPLVSEFSFAPSYVASLTLDRPLGSFFFDFYRPAFTALSTATQLPSLDGVAAGPAVATAKAAASTAAVSRDYQEAYHLLHLATALHTCAHASDIFVTENRIDAGRVTLPPSQLAIAVEVFGNSLVEGSDPDMVFLQGAMPKTQHRRVVIDELTRPSRGGPHTMDVDEDDGGDEEVARLEQFGRDVPDNFVYVHNQEAVVSAVSSSSSVLGSSTLRRGPDRVMCHVRFEQESMQSRTMQRLLRLLEFPPSPAQADRPWVDAATLQYNLPALQFFTTQLLAYLAETPGASLAQLHTLLMVLPVVAVQELLDLLVQVEILLQRQADVSVELPTAFDAMDALWGAGPVTSDVSSARFYEIAV